MKMGQSGLIGKARDGEVDGSVEQSRPQKCLIRSALVERIIGRRCSRKGGGSPRP